MIMSEPPQNGPAARDTSSNHHDTKTKDHDNDHDNDNDHHDDDDDSHAAGSDAQEPPRKRQRVRLSCLECRRRKLSCSRELPCDRCIKSGTADRCTYEPRPGSFSGPISERTSFVPAAPMVSFDLDSRHPNHNPLRRSVDASLLRESARDHDRVRRLELEVAHLKSALAKQQSVDGSTVVASPAVHKELRPEPPSEPVAPIIPDNPDGLEFKFVRGHTFKTRYFGPHNSWDSIIELNGLQKFMRATADQWLRPLNIQKKDRNKRRDDRVKRFTEPDLDLETLLPSKDETDSLIAIYLDQFEQIYRIVHVPTFKKQYASFWDPARTRSAAMTTLVLAMISVSVCLDMTVSNKFVGVKSGSFQRAVNWVKACDNWYANQSHKHRMLIHYQIACMLYLAKRVNVIKKKRFWSSTGVLIRDAIITGLHQDPEHMTVQVSPFYQEMRRRLWATMVEFDVQSSVDQGVPTLMSQVYNDADAPRNIDDDQFDEDTEELPESNPDDEYTLSSYQSLSRHSLPLRLELLRILTTSRQGLDWEQALRYTELLTQEIDALPSWDLDAVPVANSIHKPILAHTLLHLQLKQFFIPLLQPFVKLREVHSKYQIADFLYYNAARDIVIIHDKLFQRGIRSLNFLREDTMNAAVNLCNVSLRQPRDNTSWIMSNAQETVSLIEKCIAMKEDRILRCGHNDPWGYSSMCAALGLLEAHLGTKPLEQAKASAAERFISLHYRLVSNQQSPVTNPTMSGLTPGASTSESAARMGPTGGYMNHGKSSITPYMMQSTNGGGMPSQANTPYLRDGIPVHTPWLLPSADASQVLPNPDFSLEGLGTDLMDLWPDWAESTGPFS
ncbi:proline utilization trans-activator [Microdochium nivale]|nr:proline utilization trans-activator [Microdochium nivale]